MTMPAIVPVLRSLDNGCDAAELVADVDGEEDGVEDVEMPVGRGDSAGKG